MKAKQNENNKTITKKDKFYEDLVNEIKTDFERRREERRSLEQQWNLNINYLSGNQYCEISPTGDVLEEENYYYDNHDDNNQDNYKSYKGNFFDGK